MAKQKQPPGDPMTLGNMRQRVRVLASWLLVWFVTTIAHAAPAVVHRGCGSLDSIANLVEPVKDFANNAIRIAHVSTDEPAAAPDHLLIFESDSPAGDAWLAFYASPVAQQSFQEHVNAVAFADGEQVLSLNADRRGLDQSVNRSVGRNV